MRFVVGSCEDVRYIGDYDRSFRPRLTYSFNTFHTSLG
jgi:hypothetical protein